MDSEIDHLPAESGEVLRDSLLLDRPVERRGIGEGEILDALDSRLAQSISLRDGRCPRE